MANKGMKADSETALTARLGKKAKSKPGNLQDVLGIVWKALETVQAALEDTDVLIRLKASHAVFQGAQAYSKLYEVGELEARLAALEQRTAVPEKAGVQHVTN
jgi:hypothetical protein